MSGAISRSYETGAATARAPTAQSNVDSAIAITDRRRTVWLAALPLDKSAPTPREPDCPPIHRRSFRWPKPDAYGTRLMMTGSQRTAPPREPPDNGVCASRTGRSEPGTASYPRVESRVKHRFGRSAPARFATECGSAWSLGEIRCRVVRGSCCGDCWLVASADPVEGVRPVLSCRSACFVLVEADDGCGHRSSAGAVEAELTGDGVVDDVVVSVRRRETADLEVA
jgi:hypothetical protein